MSSAACAPEKNVENARSARRKQWYRKRKGRREKEKKKEAENDEASSQCEGQPSESAVPSRSPTEVFHSVMIIGVPKCRRPYHRIRSVMYRKMNLTPYEVEVNRDQHGQQTGSYIIHFPFHADIRPVYERGHIDIDGRMCKVFPWKSHEHPKTRCKPMAKYDIGNAKHRRKCILSKLNNDCWSYVLAYLDLVDLFRFQQTCSCARNVTDLIFCKERYEFVFEYSDYMKSFRKNRFGHSNFTNMLDYFDIMNIVMRYDLSRLLSLTLDLNSGKSIEVDNNLFTLLKKNCPHLINLKIIDAFFSHWKRPIKVENKIESLSIANTGLYGSPTVTDIIAYSLFSSSLRRLKSFQLVDWFLEDNVLIFLPLSLEHLKLDCHFRSLSATLDIAERLPGLKSLTLKIKSTGLSTAMTHHHLLKFTNLEELNVSSYPLYYDKQWILPDSMRVAYFAPPTLRKLTISNMHLSAEDLEMITNYCPELEYLKLKRIITTAINMPFIRLARLRDLILYEAGDGFPMLRGNLPPCIETIQLKGIIVHNPNIRDLIDYVHTYLLKLRYLWIGVGLYLQEDLIILKPSKFDPNFEVYQLDSNVKTDDIRYGRQYVVHQRRPYEEDRKWNLDMTLVCLEFLS